MYTLAKFLVSVLKPLTTNEFAVKGFFQFAEKTLNQHSDSHIGSFDVDFLLINIPLKETIKIFANKPFKESETMGALSKSEIKQLFSLALKRSHFIFYRTHYE